MFSSQMEADVFSLLPGNTTLHNLSQEEWLAMSYKWICGRPQYCNKTNKGY